MKAGKAGPDHAGRGAELRIGDRAVVEDGIHPRFYGVVVMVFDMLGESYYVVSNAKLGKSVVTCPHLIRRSGN